VSEQKLFQLHPTQPALSNAERERLLKVARLREKVAKSGAAERSARLLADFEQQMDSTYRFDSNEVWTKAVKAAEAACQIAEKAVDEECDRLGIPKRFRPRLGSAHWHGRGENAVRERRVELRRVAQTRIAAIEKAARQEIERISSEVQIELLAHGMSEHARQLLENMPKVESLMPTLQVEEIESSLKPRLSHFE
jgi:hypothetical protein